MQCSSEVSAPLVRRAAVCTPQCNPPVLYTRAIIRIVASSLILIALCHNFSTSISLLYPLIHRVRVSECERLGVERSTGYLLYMSCTHRMSCLAIAHVHVLLTLCLCDDPIRDDLIRSHIEVVRVSVRVRSSSAFIVVRCVVAPSVFSVGQFNTNM